MVISGGRYVILFHHHWCQLKGLSWVGRHFRSMTDYKTKAQELDERFPSLRDEFCHPTHKSLGLSSEEKQGTYLCGNSLGLMPKGTREALNHEMDIWAGKGVEGHFTRPDGSNGWVDQDDPLMPKLAKIVGGKDTEVALTGTLTGNLNNLLTTFYRPHGKRTKLLFEAKAFPSDNYCFQSQVRFHDLDPERELIRAFPREGEHTLRTEDILALIDEHGDEVAVVIFSGIQYYTGQKFDMARITAHAHSKGCIVGWDLAHAVGNVVLRLHDWDVDFAAFCSYKYLNCGPGQLGGLFVHERFHHDNRPRPAGWFGVSMDTRFDMEYQFKPIIGARSWNQSCTNWTAAPSLKESLKLFERAGWLEGLAPRSRSLGDFLQELLVSSPFYNQARGFSIITPLDPEERGSQISILFTPGLMEPVFNALQRQAIIGDERKPDVLRIAPTALYNTHVDVWVCVDAINRALEQLV